MDSKTIQFATAQAFLASLTGSLELKIYENPLTEIEKLCNSVKLVMGSYGMGIPEDLPIKINTEVAQEIYLRCATNNWSSETKKVEVLTPSQRKEILSRLSERYAEGLHVIDYVMRELEAEPDDFLKELDSLSNSDLTNRLNEWTSYELEDLFDRVKQSGKQKKEKPPPSKLSSSDEPLAPPRAPKKKGKKKTKKEMDPLLESFIEKYRQQEESDESLIRLRDSTSTSILRNFRKRKIPPLAYHGSKFPPSQTYVRNIFMPWLILTSNRGKTAGITTEKQIYEKFIMNYMKGLS